MTQEKPASQTREASSIGEMQVLVDGTKVTLIRTFSAPRTQVFRAWTEPERISQWWGPDGFDVPECRLDPRPGADYTIVMRSPRGQDMPLIGTILEIDEPARIVMTQGSESGDFSVVMTITFEEVAGKTRMTHTTEFGSLEDRDKSIEMGANNGWAQSFDKLEGHLVDR